MAEQQIQLAGEKASSTPPRKKRRKGRTVVRMIGRFFFALFTLLLVGVITGGFLAFFGATYIKNVILPQTELDVADYPMNLSSTIYYKDPDTGEELEYQTLAGDQNRVWVEYDNVPTNLVNALVAIEDKRFYQHHGVDWYRTAGSAFYTFTGGRTQGGSTITQQLIKNLTTYDDVTVKRKVLEIFRALEFEKKYDKKMILEWYVNYVYFGHRCYGVYTASWYYFGKDVSQLSLAECASLIGITNNPSKYDPFTYPVNNYNRRCDVLDAMCKEGYISEEERDAAEKVEIDFHTGQSSGNENTLYTWYTEQVITDVQNDLMEQYGYSETVARDIVYSGGLQIYACVDPKVQAAVDHIYSNAENLPYTSASGQQLQSAIVVIDPEGNVSALAGKMGEKTAADTRGYNMASRALRQPGSSIKPLAVYSPALEMGLITPYSVFEDSPPMLLNGQGWPDNVNYRYTGQMTVSTAVTNSTNTVAVRVLQQVTPEVGFEYMTQKYGINNGHLVTKKIIKGKEFTDVGYSQMALGGLTQGVTTMDMAGAYSVFPRNGVYIKPRTYSVVTDSNHKRILKNSTEGVPVLKEKTVYYINQLLKDVVNDGSGSGANFSGMTIAGKTGSSNSYNDRWFCGYTPYYTAAVWVGYQTPERIRVSGNPAATLWRQVMSQVHQGLEDQDFPKPAELVGRDYCRDTGLLATDECRRDVRGSRAAYGLFFPEDVPTEYCTAHVPVEVCNADPILNDKGEPTGRYHLAGEFCPEAGTDAEGNPTKGKVTVSMLNLVREYVGGVRPEDDIYLLKYLREQGSCTVHTNAIPEEPKPYDPAAFVITDPTTWPTREEDPRFDPGNPATWPTAPGWEPYQPTESAPPEETDVPVDTPVPTEGHGHSPTPSIGPVESVPPAESTPPDEHTVGPLLPPSSGEEDDIILPPGA